MVVFIASSNAGISLCIDLLIFTAVVDDYEEKPEGNCLENVAIDLLIKINTEQFTFPKTCQSKN